MMRRLSTAIAIMVAAAGVAACQGGERVAMLPGRAIAPAPQPAPSPMDGRWASTDGIFVATFRGGEFTSVDAKTNAVLAQGRYNVAGDQVRMNWLSTTANEERSATCAFSGGARVTCTQANGASFELRRA